MSIRFLSVAEGELVAAVNYYNGEKPGLGYEFAAEIDTVVQRIEQHPEAWARVSARVRRCRARRFPFGVLYQVRGDEILVIAVMDLRRDPESWKSRL